MVRYDSGFLFLCGEREGGREGGRGERREGERGGSDAVDVGNQSPTIRDVNMIDGA